MNKIKTTIFTLILFFSWHIISPNQAPACDVPVFRYALERWQPDVYEVFIFHRGDFSETDQSTLEWLKKNSAEKIIYSNFRITPIDIVTGIPDELTAVWQSLDSKELPRLVVMYPGNTGIRQVVWEGKLTPANAKILVNSPVRQQIAEKILNGNSIVWLLLESGDRMADDAAADTLRACLENMENNLLIPEQNPDSPDQSENIQEAVPDTHVKLSMLRLSRDEAHESIFINMLTYSESDLSEYSAYPIAFPIYGRGRILYALAGKGINKQNIQRACSFLTGSCSCEMKAEYPGVDLLMPVNWEVLITENAASAAPLFRNAVITLISIALFIAAVSIKILYKKSEKI